MAAKQTKSDATGSKTNIALAIYNRHLKQLRNGEVDRSISWRKKVLQTFNGVVSDSPTINATLFSKCQEKSGFKVNSDFSIVPYVKGKATNIVSVVKPPEPPVPPRKSASPTKTKNPPPIKPELLPKQGAARPKPPVQKTSTPAPVPAPGAKPVTSVKSAKARQIHTDVIAACNFEIAEAFNDLEELIENVDQLGETKTLKVFIRKTRAACKRMSDQLLAKTQIDRLQAKYVTP